MAVQQLQIPTNNINNLVDQSQWATLGNLGNVYQKAQEQQRQQAALAQLGADPTANSQFLIKSGVPDLAQLGVQMQNRLATQAQSASQFAQEQALRQKQFELLQSKFEADSPEYRGKQLDDMIKSGALPPEAKQDPAWRAWQATGQNIPSSAIVTPQTASDRKAIRDADQQAASIGQSIQQIDTLKDNIGKAFHLGPLTGPVGYAASFLPEGYGGTAGTATELATNEALRSMIGQVKASFGSNPSNKEDAWLLKAQASVDKAPAVQQQILKEARDLLVERQKFARDQAQELRPAGVKGYYGKGGGPTLEPPPVAAPVAPPAAPPVAPPVAPPAAAPAAPPVTASMAPPAAPPVAPPAAPAVKPSLKQFMDRARAHNPGVSDSELAKYWKGKYGG